MAVRLLGPGLWCSGWMIHGIVSLFCYQTKCVCREGEEMSGHKENTTKKNGTFN